MKSLEHCRPVLRYQLYPCLASRNANVANLIAEYFRLFVVGMWRHISILPILHTLPTTRACTYNTFVVVVVIFNTHHAAHRIDSSRTRGSNCTLLDDSNV